MAGEYYPTSSDGGPDGPNEKSKDKDSSAKKGSGEQAPQQREARDEPKPAKAAESSRNLLDKMLDKDAASDEVSVFSRRDEAAASKQSAEEAADTPPATPEAAAEDDTALAPTAQEERELGRDLVEAAQTERASVETSGDPMDTAADAASEQLLDRLHQGFTEDTDASAAEIVAAAERDTLNNLAPNGAERAVDMSQFVPYEPERDSLAAADVQGGDRPNPLQWERYNPVIHNAEPDDAANVAANAPPVMPGGGVGGQPPRANFVLGGMNPNVPPPLGAVLAGANRAPQAFDSGDMSRAFWGGAIIGGIIGAAIGRAWGARRERARSAADRAKMEKKFEASANALQFQITESNARARALARQVAAEKATAALPVSEVAAGAASASAIEAAPSARPQPERPVTAEPSRVAVKEAFRKPVKQMSREEILAASEHIAVGGKTLRELVDENYVTEAAVRRVLEAEEDEFERHSPESVRRHVVEQVVAAELLRYERDPLLQDHVQQPEIASAAERHQVTPEPLAPMPNQQPLPQPAGMQQTADKQRLASSKPPVPSVLVIANIVAVCILGALLLVLVIVWTHQ